MLPALTQSYMQMGTFFKLSPNINQILGMLC